MYYSFFSSFTYYIQFIIINNKSPMIFYQYFIFVGIYCKITVIRNIKSKLFIYYHITRKSINYFFFIIFIFLNPPFKIFKTIFLLSKNFMWKTYKTQNYYTHKNKYLILFHLTLLEIF